MKDTKIFSPNLIFNSKELIGESVESSIRKLGDLRGIFEDKTAFESMNFEQIAYRVSSTFPVQEGTLGGLFMGITYLMPGKVGNEYFMTKGHFHSKIDRAEFYWGVEGEGMLILMNEAREVWAERMYPGSLHYIPGGVAHRVANVGNSMLIFAASWPSDAGHNYEAIAKYGFARRLKEVNGKPRLV